MTREFSPFAALALLVFGTSAVAAAQSREGRSAVADAGDLDEDGQARRLPSLPRGMTVQLITQGDEVYRGKGGCVACHGPDGGGMPAGGSGITSGLHFIPNDWAAIDSLITLGLPEPVTRAPVAMPPRGAASNLTAEETRAVAAYVWAISQVRGEPWPGGHRTHEAAAPTDTTARSAGAQR